MYFILILELSAGLSRLSRLGTFPLPFQLVHFTHVPDLIFELRVCCQVFS